MVGMDKQRRVSEAERIARLERENRLLKMAGRALYDALGESLTDAGAVRGLWQRALAGLDGAPESELE